MPGQIPAATAAPPTGPRSNYRWQACALLLFATTVNYMDRQVLATLAPQLQRELHWDEQQYSYIVTAFYSAYAVGLLVAGRLLDAVGTKLGYAVSVVVWAAASVACSFARSWQAFAVARAFLGLGESGNFPAAVKTTAEWFPQKDRALAAGVFNSGSNLGVIVAGVLVPLATIEFGWRSAFYVTAAFDLVWLAAWLRLYHRPGDHPHVSPAELAYVRSDPPDPPGRVTWAAILPHRPAWAVAAAKVLTDPVWWFLQFWLPKYLVATYGIKLAGVALPLVVIYVAADVGSVGGGWLSSALIRRGASVNRARKSAMLLCGLLVTPMVVASYAHHLWQTVALFSLAAAGHQGWSANVYTLASDTFPRRAVGSVTGFAAMAGAVGGVVASLVIGRVLQVLHGDYTPLLVSAGCMYLLALAAVQLISPRLTPADVTLAADVSRRGFDVATPGAA